MLDYNAAGYKLNNLKLITDKELLYWKSDTGISGLSSTSRDKDDQMVAYLTASVKSEIPPPNIFNLRVEYIRATLLTRFTCSHLLPVGGEI